MERPEISPIIPCSRTSGIIENLHSTDYTAVDTSSTDAVRVGSFFGDSGFKTATFPNEQVFDYEGLQGRLLSSSYAPEPGHPRHLPMLEELRAIFDRHQNNGKVTFKYDTAVYYGRLSR